MVFGIVALHENFEAFFFIVVTKIMIKNSNPIKKTLTSHRTSSGLSPRRERSNTYAPRAKHRNIYGTKNDNTCKQ